MIKIVFFDIDGTLVPFGDSDIPQSTRVALKLLKEKGIKVFISTGRSLDSAAFVTKLFDFDGFLTANGQYVITKEGEVLYEQYLPQEVVHFVLDYCEEKKLGFVMDLEKHGYKNPYYTGLFASTWETADCNQFREEKVTQFMIQTTAEYEDEIIKNVPGQIFTRWAPDMADLLPALGGKDKGVLATLKKYGYSLDECMAFGDGDNDMSMLKIAGTGVAMGNAADFVKACANYVTTDVREDGVYNALKHFDVI